MAEWNILTRANRLNSENKNDEALKVLMFINRLLPKSIDSLGTLAQHYQKGELEP